jgi:hypothetical protein
MTQDAKQDTKKKKAAEKAARTYTEPELRQRLKEQIQAGDKGGRPGQWSARKAQLLVREYEKAGGGYVEDGRRSGTQQHLEQWGEQEWHTSGGDADARGEKGTSRYLPDVAWKLLSKAERQATEKPKKKAQEQYVGNTDAAKEARKAAELLTMKAAEARKAVASMDGRRQLKRARKAEKTYGKARKTVLAAIDERLAAD